MISVLMSILDAINPFFHWVISIVAPMDNTECHVITLSQEAKASLDSLVTMRPSVNLTYEQLPPVEVEVVPLQESSLIESESESEAIQQEIAAENLHLRQFFGINHNQLRVIEPEIVSQVDPPVVDQLKYSIDPQILYDQVCQELWHTDRSNLDEIYIRDYVKLHIKPNKELTTLEIQQIVRGILIHSSDERVSDISSGIVKRSVGLLSLID